MSWSSNEYKTWKDAYTPSPWYYNDLPPWYAHHDIIPPLPSVSPVTPLPRPWPSLQSRRDAMMPFRFVSSMSNTTKSSPRVIDDLAISFSSQGLRNYGAKSNYHRYALRSTTTSLAFDERNPPPITSHHHYCHSLLIAWCNPDRRRRLYWKNVWLSQEVYHHKELVE